MKLVVIALIALALFAIWRFRSLPAPEQQDQVTLDQIDSVWDALRRTGSEGSFAVFMSGPSVAAPEFQFSIQEGRVGLDWVLINEANVRGKEAFERMLDSAGAAYRELERNGVRFIRTEDERAPELCRRVVKEIFDFDAGASLNLIIESFEWPPKQ